MRCTGICENLRARTKPIERSHYLSGQKRCQTCGVFIYTTEVMCPCCHFKLRISPRDARSKRMFLDHKAQAAAHSKRFTQA